MAEMPLPLNGVRVVDFSFQATGPYCTELLAYLGAEVIRIEDREGKRDIFRLRQPSIYSEVNQNKCSVTIDLARSEGIDLAKKLVKASDVVVENFRPGVMNRLGLGYEILSRLRPELVMVSCSGFGSEGPEAGYASIAATFSVMSGLAAITGYPDGIPTEQRGMIDFIVGQFMAFSVLVALLYRRRTGRGQYIDLSAREAVTSIIGDVLMEHSMNRRNPGPKGNMDDVMAPHNCYPCKGEDLWVSIAVATDAEWEALCRSIGQPSLVEDERFSDSLSRWKNQGELDSLIGQWTANKTPLEVTELLQTAGVAAFPSVRSSDVFGDPHLKERGFLKELVHPEFGKVTCLGSPWSLSDVPDRVQRRGPSLGEHNEYVLGGILGLPAPQIDKLRQQEVI